MSFRRKKNPKSQAKAVKRNQKNLKNLKNPKFQAKLQHLQTLVSKQKPKPLSQPTL